MPCGKDENKCTLTSLIPKKDENVLMLCTLHIKDKIDVGSPHNKPGVIKMNNVREGGVDAADNMKT